jgi:hypothetical protein
VDGEPSLRRLLGGSGCCLASAAILRSSLCSSPAPFTPARVFWTVLIAWGASGAVGSALVSRLRHQALLSLVAVSFVVMAVSYLGRGLDSSVTVLVGFSFLGGSATESRASASMTAHPGRLHGRGGGTRGVDDGCRQPPGLRAPRRHPPTWRASRTSATIPGGAPNAERAHPPKSPENSPPFRSGRGRPEKLGRTCLMR